jgi:phosphoenolpyruvate carboxylase
MRVDIPRCMSTQHPDNVQSPFFATTSVLGGDEEIQEAYYAFSHLGCEEQMWDCEGKEVDNHVIRKLITKHQAYFEQHRLGKEHFITLRVPNPTVERAEAKILLETLDSIPRSYDATRALYGDETPPVFEVILPMTTSHRCLDRIYRYYRDFIVAQQYTAFHEGDITIRDWIGEFCPERINVIPLFEAMPHMLNAHHIVREYLRDKDVEYQRVFLARSDPAMNYGAISAVLLNKIALQRLHGLSREIGVRLYPIVGVGSAPFRGNMRPQRIENVTREYPSTQTFTIQSAFKYDNTPEEVRAAIQTLRERPVTDPSPVDEDRCLELIGRFSAAYQEQVAALAPIINRVSRYIPPRRMRKLHIGLFGYAREVGQVKLPRAISFTCALYSIGLPPELLGLTALSDDDIDFIRTTYLGFDEDLRDALRFFNPTSSFLPAGLAGRVRELAPDMSIDPAHLEITSRIMDLLGRNDTADLTEHLVAAAGLRKFLG